MDCGRPSSLSVKSSLVRLLMILPCLSRTVASTFTTFTWTDIVVTDWSAEFPVAFFVCAPPPNCATAMLNTIVAPAIKEARHAKLILTVMAFQNYADKTLAGLVLATEWGRTPLRRN